MEEAFVMPATHTKIKAPQAPFRPVQALAPKTSATQDVGGDWNVPVWHHRGRSGWRAANDSARHYEAQRPAVLAEAFRQADRVQDMNALQLPGAAEANRMLPGGLTLLTLQTAAHRPAGVVIAALGCS